jgi:hypothetical protein
VTLGSLAALTELQRTGNVDAQDSDGGFEFNGRFSNELVYEQMIKKIMANEDTEYRAGSLGNWDLPLSRNTDTLTGSLRKFVIWSCEGAMYGVKYCLILLRAGIVI